MGDRNKELINGNPNPFYDQNCAEDGSGHSVGEAHNYLTFGSEAPHQLGWYLVTLASEYELLRQNGQVEEQQRTLEEIFLALQAYRRLDITANCLVKERYDEITAGYEVENCDIWVLNHHYQDDACLCGEKYHNQQCPGDNKWHFDIPCKRNCPWSPDLSGYSGFFIRQDATQEQEALNDYSEDKWNIDLVGDSYAMAEKPPCTTEFSRTCYMEKNVTFMSSDQAYLMMY